jgi:hypothetical protein
MFNAMSGDCGRLWLLHSMGHMIPVLAAGHVKMSFTEDHQKSAIENTDQQAPQ